MLLGPVEHHGQPGVVLLGHSTLDKLRLAAISMRVDNQSAGNLVGDALAKVLAHDMEAKVDPSRAAGRRQHVALVDVQDIWLNRDSRVHLCKFRRISPVGGCAAAIQQSSCSYDECAGAYCSTFAVRRRTRPDIPEQSISL